MWHGYVLEGGARDQPAVIFLKTKATARFARSRMEAPLSQMIPTV